MVQRRAFLHHNNELLLNDSSLTTTSRTNTSLRLIDDILTSFSL